MKTHHFYPCEVCRGTTFKTVGSAGLYSRRTAVAVCLRCGLACLNPRWDEARYAAYYASEYTRPPSPPETPDERADDLAAVIASESAPDTPVVDIGAGAGGVLWRLAQRGWSNLHAIEVDPRCHPWIDGIPHVQRWAQAEDAPLSGVVVLSHVLEHFVHPVAMLTALRSRMSEDTRVMIAVPLNWGASPVRAFTVPHTHYFTRTTLLTTLRAAGFGLVELPTSVREGADLQVVARPKIPYRAEGDREQVRATLAACRRRTLMDRGRLGAQAIVQAVIPEEMFWATVRRVRRNA